MPKYLTLALLTQLVIVLCACFEAEELAGIGYRIGKVSAYKELKSYNQSKLYELESAELDDGRPIKLMELVGTHYEAGYAYAALIGKQIVQTYNTFFNASFSHQWQIQLLELFLSWQYDEFVHQQIPMQFKEEMHGLQKGGEHEHNIRNLRVIFQRTLVVSSYPGDFSYDIIYTLLDQFLREYLPSKNEKLINIIEDQIFQVVKFLKNILNKKRIHCSFFAIWGKRTQGGKLITMRNLDWQANTGINKNKLIIVWKITNTIPHLTLAFPGLIGALTGMSRQGLTVHEAGIDSMRATELGFHWSLRLRYIMMYANNLAEARQIWQSTNNTLGMNHMIASAKDLASDCPAYAMETMRNYTAWFRDDDEREKGTIFVDPKSKQKFRAGYAMKQAIFRTNHAYDPFINKYRTQLPSRSSSTVHRYLVLSSGLSFYEQAGIRMSNEDALNVTAATAHKGSNDPYKCPGAGDNGTNVISVLYTPATLEMYVGFEYGVGKDYKTACCGVYVYVDMAKWLK